MEESLDLATLRLLVTSTIAISLEVGGHSKTGVCGT